jgi:methylaspartate ammonia-lyase
LAAEVDGWTERVTINRPLRSPEPEDEDDAEATRLSRRDLFTAPARWLQAAQADQPQTEQVTIERRLHTAVRYGVSQALLKAVALAHGMTVTGLLCQEYGLPLPAEPVPIHAQCGADRYAGADKMIARRVASLPHSLVDNIPEQLGEDGQILLEYARWLRGRIPQLAGDDYRPTLHLDVHGALGHIYDNNLGKMLGFLVRLETAAGPYALRVESPLILDSRQAQIEAMAKLREYIRWRKQSVQLVADEWANTLEDIQAFIAAGAADMIQIKMPDLGGVHNSVEAVLACQRAGVGAFLGGSCAETDLSARVAAHVALATRPDLVMAKPGMGVDEGVALMHNEMARALAAIRYVSTGPR